MQLRLGYTIELTLSKPMAVVAVVNVHHSRVRDLIEPDEPQILPEVPCEPYTDSFGNRCLRFRAPEGALHLSNSTLIEDSGDPDPIPVGALQHPIEECC